MALWRTPKYTRVAMTRVFIKPFCLGLRMTLSHGHKKVCEWPSRMTTRVTASDPLAYSERDCGRPSRSHLQMTLSLGCERVTSQPFEGSRNTLSHYCEWVYTPLSHTTCERVLTTLSHGATCHAKWHYSWRVSQRQWVNFSWPTLHIITQLLKIRDITADHLKYSKKER